MKRYKLYFLLIIITALNGCGDFLDINEDPNNPGIDNAPASLLLSGVQVDMSESLGMQVGGLGQITSLYMHQIVRRGSLNDYGVSGNDGGITNPWDNLFANVLTDVDILINDAEASGQLGYSGVGKLIKAYTYSIMVDVWGDVPYTERGLGQENPAPVFDDGEDIYAEVHLLIDEAIADLSSDTPGEVEGDLIYGGELDEWIRFGNTLKLKMYNQVRLVQNVSTDVQELMDADMFIDDIEFDFELNYGTSQSPDDRNPGYSQEYAEGAAFYSVSPYLFEIMTGRQTFFPQEGNPLNGISDPRAPYYWYNQLSPGEDAENPTSYKVGEFVSIYAFSFNIDPNEGFDQSSSKSILGLYPVGGAYDAGEGGTASFSVGRGDAPLRMLTYYDVLFIMTELANAEVIAADERVLFEQAMIAAFNKVNEVASAASAPTISDADRNDYIDEVLAIFDGANQDDRLRLIMTEKWIASFGFGVDSYTDYRRTGYPLLHDGNTDNLNVTVRTRDYPVSLPYNINDISLNPNAPPQRRTALDKVFWDN
ncbi:SusD/RagB family nutrient-binding outer membrane lipoprotein [Fulvivirga maritima]|uniref:SusD/RagB family nutrient-binding outer membrane lipoprotein n=1 Tax=Fulvivirga maritima TaxID=2904247 RepID=UPI001F393D18|nr:SusD/RagB family nutrient-binding outer membrane lipoprotein [Fulvivirga maritima]UII27082.1 SusD/RagB family nutrient-binding outer membrane lipoprotein [Fulvivirga maritima]